MIYYKAGQSGKYLLKSDSSVKIQSSGISGTITITPPTGAQKKIPLRNEPYFTELVGFVDGTVFALSVISGGGSVGIETDAECSSDSLNIRDYGVIMDGVVINNYNSTNSGASIANGSKTINSATATFTPSAVGKNIIICSATGNVFYRSIIDSYVSPTQVIGVDTHSAATIAAGTGSMCYGTDDTVAFQTALDAMAAKGGTLNLPVGTLCITSRVNIPHGVNVVGSGMDYGRMEQIPSIGTSIVLVAAPNLSVGAVRLGSFATQSQLDSGTTIGSLRNLNVDGCNGNGSAVEMYGRRTRVDGCLIKRGTLNSLYNNSQNSWVTNNIIGQDNVGHVLTTDQPDIKIYNNEMRQAGAGHQINVNNPIDIMIRGNHMWKGAALGSLSASHPGSNVYIRGTVGSQNVSITDNSFDGTYGSHVQIDVEAGQSVQGVTITGNTAFQTTGFPDNTFPFLGINLTATGRVVGLSVTGNSGKALSGALRYSHFVKVVGTVTDVVGAAVTANTVAQCALTYSAGFTPDTVSTGNYTA